MASFDSDSFYEKLVYIGEKKDFELSQIENDKFFWEFLESFNKNKNTIKNFFIILKESNNKLSFFKGLLKIYPYTRNVLLNFFEAADFRGNELVQIRKSVLNIFHISEINDLISKDKDCEFETTVYNQDDQLKLNEKKKELDILKNKLQEIKNKDYDSQIEELKNKIEIEKNKNNNNEEITNLKKIVLTNCGFLKESKEYKELEQCFGDNV